MTPDEFALIQTQVQAITAYLKEKVWSKPKIPRDDAPTGIASSGAANSESPSTSALVLGDAGLDRRCSSS